jgi:hypothetical protein
METNRREEILTAVTAELTSQGYEVTSENLYWCLTGLQDGWKEDPSTSLEKSLYMIALSGLILTTSIDMMFEKN